MIENTGLQVYDAINEDSKLPNIEYPDTDASKAIIEFHACKYQAIMCLMISKGKMVAYKSHQIYKYQNSDSPSAISLLYNFRSLNLFFEE